MASRYEPQMYEWVDPFEMIEHATRRLEHAQWLNDDIDHIMRRQAAAFAHENYAVRAQLDNLMRLLADAKATENIPPIFMKASDFPR